MLKNKKFLSSSKPKKILSKENIQKENSVRALKQFSAWTPNRIHR